MSGGRLTTHVLDTANGCPAGGMRIELWSLPTKETKHLIKTVQTNKDGRTDEPLLSGDGLKKGAYALAFYVGDYFVAKGAQLSDPPFLDVVPVRFAVAD